MLYVWMYKQRVYETLTHTRMSYYRVFCRVLARNATRVKIEPVVDPGKVCRGMSARWVQKHLVRRARKVEIAELAGDVLDSKNWPPRWHNER